MTHYTTLRIARTASERDIKLAYRRLAMEHHPDRHPPGLGQKKAEAEFKRVQEAYAVLSDAQKRARYDQLFDEQPRYAENPRSTARSGHAPRKPVDIRHLDRRGDIELSARSWYEGCWIEVTLDVPRIVACPACQGARGGCECCNYQGKVRRFKERAYIPPRTNYNGRLVVSNAGGIDAYGNQGNLFVSLHVQALEGFWLEGSNLHTSVTVPPAVLRFGTSWNLPVVDGTALCISIPARMKNGGKLRLAGYGVLRNGNEHGDMLVEIKSAVPATWSDKLRNGVLHAGLGVRHALRPLASWWKSPATRSS